MAEFSKEKKTNTAILLSVADGEVVDLSSVPDEAFSSGMLGEGFAVKPRGDCVFAPADGVIGTVSESGHAYSIASDVGDLLVHIGVDTLSLREVFKPLVNPGQKVEAGQPIAHVDFSKIRAAGLCDSVILLITEKKISGGINIQKRDAKGGKDIALRVEK